MHSVRFGTGASQNWTTGCTSTIEVAQPDELTIAPRGSKIASKVVVTKQWILAFRSLRRRPGFVIAMVAVLAVGIGANTAVFSMLDAVLLRPLPYPDADRLVMVLEASPASNARLSLFRS